ncbi:hypothetical protein DM860_004372 [Cuscuta australis]|uniref:Arabinogalactan peptide 23-like n=1 Tax=Cuscuta australis TaxID=267555 RepID=A0A328EBP8_9ASTE|nr:hypothetical protein DM860_004372 [Cuscuta australis]
MEMKKIACAAALAAAASFSMALADEVAGGSPVPTAAQAPSPISDAIVSAIPTVGSLVGASLLSFFAAVYMH